MLNPPQAFQNVLYLLICGVYQESKQIIKFSCKRGLNGCPGVIRYVDSEYAIVNNI